MKTLLTRLVAAAIPVREGLGFAYSGFCNASAAAPHNGPVGWLRSSHSCGISVPMFIAPRLTVVRDMAMGAEIERMSLEQSVYG